MTCRNNKKQLSYFLRTQSSILNGEQLTPASRFPSTSKSKNNNNTANKMYCSCSVKKKQKKINKIINNNENFNYRGIDLNKVSGCSHSANNIQIYKRNSKNNDNKNTNNHIQKSMKNLDIMLLT